MIPCCGIHGSRQQINNNSIQEEYKVWVLVAEAYGYEVQFRPYQGAKKRKTGYLLYKMGIIGENVIMWLMLISNC